MLPLPDPKQLAKLLAGKFIVFDGPDGAGKSTVHQRVSAYLKEGGLTVTDVREPGGTGYGELIRNVLLHEQPTNGEELDKVAEMLLFMAARLQLMNRIVIPALKAGETVLADRFVSSTLAYQGHAMGIDSDFIIDIHKLAIPQEYWPDCTVLFDVSAGIARQRMNPRLRKSAESAGQKGHSVPGLDKIEQRSAEFREKVRFGYLKQAAKYEEYTTLVDANEGQDEVFELTLRKLEKFFRQGRHGDVGTV